MIVLRKKVQESIDSKAMKVLTYAETKSEGMAQTMIEVSKTIKKITQTLNSLHTVKLSSSEFKIGKDACTLMLWFSEGTDPVLNSVFIQKIGYHPSPKDLNSLAERLGIDLSSRVQFLNVFQGGDDPSHPSFLFYINFPFYN
jgi:hypothetical protein